MKNKQEQAIAEKTEYDFQLDIQYRREREQHYWELITAQKRVAYKLMLAEK